MNFSSKSVRIFESQSEDCQSVQQVRETSCFPKLYLQKPASELDLVWRTKSNGVVVLITPGIWSCQEFQAHQLWTEPKGHYKWVHTIVIILAIVFHLQADVDENKLKWYKKLH